MTVTTLGVILAWFVLGQKPEPSVLLSEQNPVYFEASVTRETTGSVERHSSKIRQLVKGSPFLFRHLSPRMVLNVCLYVYTVPRAKPYQVHSAELGKVVTTRLGLGRGIRDCPRYSSPQFPPILARLGESSSEPGTSSVDHICHSHTTEKEGRLPPVQITLV